MGRKKERRKSGNSARSEMLIVDPTHIFSQRRMNCPGAGKPIHHPYPSIYQPSNFIPNIFFNLYLCFLYTNPILRLLLCCSATFLSGHFDILCHFVMLLFSVTTLLQVPFKNSLTFLQFSSQGSTHNKIIWNLFARINPSPNICLIALFHWNPIQKFIRTHCNLIEKFILTDQLPVSHKSWQITWFKSVQQQLTHSVALSPNKTLLSDPWFHPCQLSVKLRQPNCPIPRNFFTTDDINFSCLVLLFLDHLLASLTNYYS